MRILLIEDDAQLGDSIRNAIKSEGYAFDWVQSCQDASSAVKDWFFNLIVLDRMLPDGDGIDWLSAQRNSGLDIPVLMLTARTSAEDKVAGLDRGADDYLTKPFDLDEFFARIRALTRRGKVLPSRSISVGKIRIDPDTSLVSVNERYIDLSKTEFDLLLILAKRSGQFVSKSALEKPQVRRDHWAGIYALCSSDKDTRLMSGMRIIVTSAWGALRTLGECP